MSKKSSTDAKNVPLREGLQGKAARAGSSLVDNGAQGQGFSADALVQIKGGAQGGQAAPASAVLSALPKGGTGTEKASGNQGSNSTSGGKSNG